MKIVSYNVNGLRAILAKDFDNIFNNLNADIFSLNETKLSDGITFPFNPNNYFIYESRSSIKKGYSGVVIFTKIKPLNVIYGINNKYNDEGRVITLEFDNFYYVASYVPNSGEELKRLPFRLEYEQDLANYLVSLDKIKPVIYAGDLNVAHEEIDIKNPKSNEKNAGFTKEEREAFTNLLSLGFIDTFRYLYPNEIKYSWWSYRFNAKKNNAGWRIDYFVVSKRFIDKIKDSEILTDIEGSDHCPIRLSVDE